MDGGRWKERLRFSHSTFRLRPLFSNLLQNPAFKITFNQFRSQTLPFRLLSELPAEVLVELLSNLLATPVYFEKAGIQPPAAESQIAKTFGKGRIVTTPQFGTWIKSAFSGQGRVLLDSAWLERLVEKNPRALYILLSALQKFQEDRNVSEPSPSPLPFPPRRWRIRPLAEKGRGIKGEGYRRPSAKAGRAPLIAVVGEEQSIFKELKEALLRKDNGLNWEEKLEVRNLLLPHLKELIGIVSPETLQHYLESHNYGVAALLPSGRGTLSGLPLGAQFILNPEEVSDSDLTAVALVIPALLKAAALVRGIKNPTEQALILKPYLDQIVPGATPQARGFVIQLAQYIQQVLLTEHLVSVSA